MNTQAGLAGLHILITRPKQQANAICQQLAQLGATVSCLPVIEIGSPKASDKAFHVLQQIDKYDNVIFISRNAVVWAVRLHGTLSAAKLSECRVGAIGNKTAAVLHEYGISTQDVPAAGFNSEHFLALDSMQPKHIAGCDVLIVRGEGGRELLAQTLKQRGASVAYAEVYRRVCPPADTAQNLLQRQRVLPLDVIAVTSCEGLSNLMRLLNSPDWMLVTPLLVGSERIASDARRFGFKADIIVAANPGDNAMLQALSDWTGNSA